MIRKGDLIKVEWDTGGVNIVQTGVAHHKEGTKWYTEAGRWLYNGYSTAKVTVLQRALPTDTGAVLKSAVLEDGTTVGMLVLCSDKTWFDPAGYIWYKPEEITDFEVGGSKVIIAVKFPGNSKTYHYYSPTDKVKVGDKAVVMVPSRYRARYDGAPLRETRAQANNSRSSHD